MATTPACTRPRRSRAATPPTAWQPRVAQDEYERMYDALGGKPINQRLAIALGAAGRAALRGRTLGGIGADPRDHLPRVHTKPTQIPTEGVGIVEAPRGTLTHHYWTDERGMVTKANLIVGTTNNYAPIQMSTHKAAQRLIKKGKVTEGLLNMVEMAFRAYDPCFGCATHHLPGQMPLEITIRNSKGEMVDLIKQFVD